MKKGFTLIELLAVIVILAIIALIATPIILGIINDTKKGARERSIDNIIHAAEIHYAQEKMKDVNTSNKINIEDIKDKIDGEIPEGGYIILNEAGDAIFALEFKDKTYVKLSTGEIVEEPKNADKYYIKVETTVSSEKEPFLGGPITKEQIEKVTTVPTNKVPSDVIGSFDVTDTTKQNETGKVMAWYYDKDSNGLYEVYIGQEGRVKANPNSGKLFNYMKNVKEIDLTYLDTSNVTDMQAMFQWCENLEKIIGLENFNMEKVEYLRYMFSNCHKLQTLNLENFKTSNVKNMDRMFQNCISLISIDVSSFDTSNVENMNRMFAGTKIDDVPNYMKLQRIIGLENFDTSKVTDMYGMFGGCSSLTDLDLRSFDTSGVTDMSYMFNDCRSLKELKLSNKFITNNVITMVSMFQRCNSLTTLDLRSFDISKVTDMSRMFYNTTNLKPIYIGENWKKEISIKEIFYGSKTTSVEEMCGPSSTHSYCTIN